jgi:hypothetical protein
MVDAVAERAVQRACLGCTFTLAAAEFPDPDHKAHQAALAYKRRLLDLLVQWAMQAGAKQPQALAEGLMLLTDGAWSAARVFGPNSYAGRVSEAARVLMAASI